LTAPEANNNLALNFLMLVPSTAQPNSAVAVTPAPGAVNVAANAPIEVVIYDGASAVDQSTVKMKVNAADVPATVSKSGGVTRGRFSPATLWNANTTYNVSVSFNDSAPRSVDWAFTTGNYQILTPAMKVKDASVRGFVWRMFQNEANQDTTVQRAEDALAGRLRDGSGNPLQNYADPYAFGPASDTGSPLTPGTGTMTFKIPTVINVNQNPGGTAGYFTPDDGMPGIPGITGSTDGIAVEITTFIELARGFYTMGVNSDDGFRTYAGFLNDNPMILGEYNGGRSAADTLFQFGVLEDGVYAFRTIYFEGGGDATIEWFVVNPDGSRSLINDSDNGGPKSYQQGTVPQRPAENVVIKVKLNSSGQVVLEWTAGTLEAADKVDGPYNAVSGASSPLVVTPAGQKFYRVRVM
jgi:hypothetical protein